MQKDTISFNLSYIHDADLNTTAETCTAFFNKYADVFSNIFQNVSGITFLKSELVDVPFNNGTSVKGLRVYHSIDGINNMQLVLYFHPNSANISTLEYTVEVYDTDDVLIYTADIGSFYYYENKQATVNFFELTKDNTFVGLCLDTSALNNKCIFFEHIENNDYLGVIKGDSYNVYDSIGDHIVNNVNISKIYTAFTASNLTTKCAINNIPIDNSNVLQCFSVVKYIQTATSTNGIVSINGTECYRMGAVVDYN